MVDLLGVSPVIDPFLGLVAGGQGLVLPIYAVWMLSCRTNVVRHVAMFVRVQSAPLQPLIWSLLFLA